MTSLAFNPAAITPAWNAFQNSLPVKMGTIQNEADYDRVIAFMNGLLNILGNRSSATCGGKVYINLMIYYCF